MIEPTAAVRGVIVNHDGGELLVRAVGSILAQEWDGPVHVVVVDNASTDGSVEAVRGESGVVVIDRATNEGFGANNRGFADLLPAPDDDDLSALRDLPVPDAVLLLNPDAVLEEGALAHLAAELDPAGRVGAAAPHIVFDRPFGELTAAMTGPIVTAVIVDGVDRTAECHITPPGYRVPGRSGPIWCHEGADGGTALRVPIADDIGPAATVRVEPRGAELPLERLDVSTVVQNAASRIDEHGWGRNRRFLERDTDASEVRDAPLWCGAAALLSASMLREIGGFEPAYFLYYEDTDLGLRGLAHGWTSRYVPEARVRHRHSDRSTQGSELVEVLQHRNRLLTLVRHAPAGVALAAHLRAARTPVSLVTPRPGESGDVRAARRRLGRWRARALVGSLRRLPAAMSARRQLDSGRRVGRRDAFERAIGAG